MLIGGIPFHDADFQSIINALWYLPSGFSEAPLTKISASIHESLANNSEDNTPLGKKAVSRCTRYWDEKDYGDAEESTLKRLSMRAFEARQACIEDSKARGDINAELYHHVRQGFECIDMSIPESGLTSLNEAARICVELGRYDFLKEVLEKNDEAIRDCIANQEELGNQQEVSALRSQLRAVRQQYLGVYFRGKNEPSEPDATLVTQGQLAFTDTKPSGTADVHDCLFVAIHDPNSGKVGIYHMDSYKEVSGLQQAMDHLSASPESQPLQVRFVGAQHADMNANLKKAIEFFQGKNVDIISAQVLNQEQQSSIVVYPKPSQWGPAFTIREAVPGIIPPNANVSLAKICLEADPLFDLAFDSTVSDQVKPVLLHPNEDFDLIRGKTETELYERFENERLTNPNMKVGEVIRRVELSVIANECHEQAVSKIHSCLDEKIDLLKADLANQGLTLVDVDKSDIERAKEIIGQREIWIGEGADAFNKPLMDFISTPDQFITVKVGEDKTASAHFDFHSLDKLSLQQPSPVSLPPAQVNPRAERVEILVDAVAHQYKDHVQRTAIDQYLQELPDDEIELLHSQISADKKAFNNTLQHGLIAHLNSQATEAVLTPTAVTVLANIESSQREGIEKNIVKNYLNSLRPVAKAAFLTKLPHQTPYAVLEEITSIARTSGTPTIQPRHADEWRRHYLTERYNDIKEEIVSHTGASKQELDIKFTRILNAASSGQRRDWLLQSHDQFLANMKNVLKAFPVQRMASSGSARGRSGSRGGGGSRR